MQLIFLAGAGLRGWLRKTSTREIRENHTNSHSQGQEGKGREGMYSYFNNNNKQVYVS